MSQWAETVTQKLEDLESRLPTEAMVSGTNHEENTQ